MPLKSRMDAKKTEAERLQAIVVDLLREEDNKYCADCEAKQPRWASWNLGVFLCIRCAGIHRNLGVHLTKVKSVNLDSWTPEQVQSMRVMGNKMARRVYEAELPEHFRRPQTDSALESFIRAKYEHKRYILKDWSPPPVDVNDLPPPPDKRHHSDHSLRSSAKKGEHNSGSVEKTRNSTGNSSIPKVTVDTKVGTVTDAPLLDFDTPTIKPENTFSQPFVALEKTTVDLNSTIMGTSESDGMEDFGPIVSAPPANSQSDIFATDAVASSSSNFKSGVLTSGSENNLEDLASVLGANPVNEKKSTSDILALYGTGPKFYAKTARNQRGMQQFPEVPSGDDNVLGKPEIAVHLPDASNVGTFFGPPVIPPAQPSFRPNASQSGFGHLTAFGPAMSTLSAGNFFLNRETAAVFAAASPFANVTMATGSTAFPGSETAAVGCVDLAAAPDGFAGLNKEKPCSGDSRSSVDFFTDNKEETKNAAQNHFMADFSQLSMDSESRERNSVQTNISWN